MTGRVGAIFCSWALFDVFGVLLLFFFLISYRFRMDFGRILGEFWWMLGGFTPDFLDIFRIFIENRDFVKNSVFPRKNQYFSGFKLFKITEKSNKNRCKC